MKATNKNRKYDRYNIKITYHNGDVEEVNYKSNTDTSNFKEMLQIYTDTKEKYINNKDIAIIEFIGISEKGEIGVIYTKPISKYIESEIEDILDRDIRDQMKELNILIEAISKQKKNFDNIIIECMKRRDTLLHETFLLDNVEDDDNTIKIDLLHKLKENEEKRRFAKNNLKDIKYLYKKININKLKMVVHNLTKERELNGCDKEQPQHYKDRVEFKVTYRDDIERVRLIRSYKNQYDEMKNDVANKTLYFYNHVGEGKRKSKKKHR